MFAYGFVTKPKGLSPRRRTTPAPGEPGAGSPFRCSCCEMAGLLYADESRRRSAGRPGDSQSAAVASDRELGHLPVGARQARSLIGALGRCGSASRTSKCC